LSLASADLLSQIKYFPLSKYLLPTLLNKRRSLELFLHHDNPMSTPSASVVDLLSLRDMRRSFIDFEYSDVLKSAGFSNK
jgi:hypothetical protein